MSIALADDSPPSPQRNLPACLKCAGECVSSGIPVSVPGKFGAETHNFINLVIPRNSMRILATIAIALVGSTLNCVAQKIEVRSGELRSNIAESNLLQVPEGKILEIVDFFTTVPRTPSAAGRVAVIETSPANGEFLLAQARSWTGSPLGGLRKIQLVAGTGGLEVRVRAEVGSHVQYYLYYRILDNVSTAATQTAQTVVIPEDATGDVEIILESSKDLVNWTVANPGTYNSQTTEQRFFRVRAVKVEAE